MIALGIDYGDARIGIAASDATGLIAHPVETIQVAKTDPFWRITELYKEKGADTIVVGLPLRMDGSEGTAAEKVRGFIRTLTGHLPAAEIVEIDERLTTKEAHKILKNAGHKGKRNNQAIIDQAAAVLILQDYLDQQPLH